MSKRKDVIRVGDVVRIPRGVRSVLRVGYPLTTHDARVAEPRYHSIVSDLAQYLSLELGFDGIFKHVDTTTFKALERSVELAILKKMNYGGDRREVRFGRPMLYDVSGKVMKRMVKYEGRREGYELVDQKPVVLLFVQNHGLFRKEDLIKLEPWQDPTR